MATDLGGWTSPLVRELVTGTWFILSAVLALMFAFIAQRVWRAEGYRAIATKAALALMVFFGGLSLSQGWFWAHIWLPRHGFAYALTWINAYPWFPIITAFIAMTGSLCLIRVFFPVSQPGDSGARDLVWIIPILIVIIVKMALAFV